MKTLGRLSVDEAAARALVSTETIRDWIFEERITAVMYAGRWWIDEKSLVTATKNLAPGAS